MREIEGRGSWEEGGLWMLGFLWEVEVVGLKAEIRMNGVAGWEAGT